MPSSECQQCCSINMFVKTGEPACRLDKQALGATKRLQYQEHGGKIKSEAVLQSVIRSRSREWLQCSVHGMLS